MKQTTVIRVTGELCFFFAVLNVFEAFQDWWLPMAVFTAACFALGFLIVRLRNKWARLALSLLPGLSFLLCPLSWLLFFPAMVWLYYVIVMTRGNYAMPLDEYRRTYTALMVICLLFVAGNIANSTIYRGQLISPACLAYTFLFLFLGVVAMRRMQMNAEMSRSWKLSNALSVAGFPLLAVGVSTLIFLFLRYTQPAVKYLLIPVGKFLNWLSMVLFPSLTENMQNGSSLKPDVNALPMGPEGVAQHGVRGAFDADSMSTSHLQIEQAASIGAYVLLALLLLAALVLVVRHARRFKPLYEEQQTQYDDTVEDLPPERGRRSKRTLPGSNAHQLRRIYKTYLEYSSGLGVSRSPSDTSQDILERTEKVRHNEEARQLRELYLAARYGDPEAVTRDQVRQAQDCLERILGEK